MHIRILEKISIIIPIGKVGGFASIRPTMIGTEPTLGIGPASEVELFVILSPVGPYFSSGFEPVNLLADPNFVRSWPGGSGYSKMGSNYAPTIYVGVSKLGPVNFIFFICI